MIGEPQAVFLRIRLLAASPAEFQLNSQQLAEEIGLLGPTGSRRIDRLVQDLVETSEEAGDIRQSDEIGGAMHRLRSFMFERVYLSEHARAEHRRAAAIVRRVFDHLMERGDSVDDVVDYVAGMTDRFAISFAEAL